MTSNLNNNLTKWMEFLIMNLNRVIPKNLSQINNTNKSNLIKILMLVLGQSNNSKITNFNQTYNKMI